MRAADAPTLHRGVVAILCPRLYPTRYAYACGILVYLARWCSERLDQAKTRSAHDPSSTVTHTTTPVKHSRRDGVLRRRFRR